MSSEEPFRVVIRIEDGWLYRVCNACSFAQRADKDQPERCPSCRVSWKVER